MKKIRFFRHSLKNGDFISPEGFQLIEEKKDFIPRVAKIFVSPYVRTIQTAAHMMAITEQKKVEIIQLESIGNPEVEKEIFAHEGLMKDYKSNPKQNLYSLMRKHFGIAELAKLESKSFKMLQEIFDKMEEHEMVIAVGHSPYIFMANNCMPETEVLTHNMSEMEYVDIEL